MKTILSILFVASCFLCNAQNAEALLKDVKSIEGITNLMLDILSGPKGEKRNWALYKSLFVEGASMNIVNANAPLGKQIKTIPIDEFIEKYSAVYSRDGFEEYATGLEINEFNGVANAFQCFYCKNLIGTYENRGVNTYQLVYAEDRWWITNVAFANETDDIKVPEKYLFTKNKE